MGTFTVDEHGKTDCRYRYRVEAEDREVAARNYAHSDEPPEFLAFTESDNYTKEYVEVDGVGVTVIGQWTVCVVYSGSFDRAESFATVEEANAHADLIKGDNENAWSDYQVVIEDTSVVMFHDGEPS